MANVTSFFNFKGNLNDLFNSSPNSAYVDSSSYVPDRFGSPNSALDISDLPSGMTTLAKSTSISSGSISFWVYFKVPPTGIWPIVHFKSDFPSEEQLSFNTNQFQTFVIHFKKGGGWINYDASFTAGVWHFITIIIGGTKCIAYVDGTPAFPGDLVSPFSSPFSIILGSTSAVYLDDIKIWSIQLTQSEMLVEYRSLQETTVKPAPKPKPTPTPPPTPPPPPASDSSTITVVATIVMVVMFLIIITYTLKRRKKKGPKKST